MTRQERAAAVRPVETHNRFLMILASIGVAVALLWSVAAQAGAGAEVPQGQDPPGMDDSNSGDGVTPPPEDGVITPPDVGDEAINQPAPDADPGTTPVIPPEQLPEQPKQDP